MFSWCEALALCVVWRGIEEKCNNRDNVYLRLWLNPEALLCSLHNTSVYSQGSSLIYKVTLIAGTMKPWGTTFLFLLFNFLSPIPYTMISWCWCTIICFLDCDAVSSYQAAKAAKWRREDSGLEEGRVGTRTRRPNNLFWGSHVLLQPAARKIVPVARVYLLGNILAAPILISLSEVQRLEAK